MGVKRIRKFYGGREEKGGEDVAGLGKRGNLRGS